MNKRKKNKRGMVRQNLPKQVAQLKAAQLLVDLMRVAKEKNLPFPDIEGKSAEETAKILMGVMREHKIL